MGEAYFGVGHIKNIGRTGAKSAVATAAYHGGISLTNEYDGLTHDYSHKRDVGATHIWVPDSAPSAWRDESIDAKARLGIIWNDIELADTAENARLARQWHLCIPHELTPEQGYEAIDRFVQRYCMALGMGVTGTEHAQPGNLHYDLMAFCREYGADGQPQAKWKKTYLCRNADGEEAYYTAERLRWADGYEKVYRYKKDEEERQMTPSEAAGAAGWERVSKHPVSKKEKVSGWDDHNLAEEWRAGWETVLNEMFTELGIDAYVDRRSYADRGEGRIATVHEGRGKDREERRAYNAAVRDHNRAMDDLQESCEQLLDDMRGHFLALYDPEARHTEESVEHHAAEFRGCADALELVAQERVLTFTVAERFKRAMQALKRVFAEVLSEWRDLFKGARKTPQNDAVGAEEALEEVGFAVEDIIADARHRADGLDRGSGSPLGKEQA